MWQYKYRRSKLCRLIVILKCLIVITLKYFYLIRNNINITLITILCLLEREMLWLVDSNFLLAWLRFLYCEMRVVLNVEPYCNLS